MLRRIEKFFAKQLNRNLAIKNLVKSIYTLPFNLVGSFFFKSKIVGAVVEFGEDSKESFFGYYDLKPDNFDGKVLCHQSIHSTFMSPNPNNQVEICVFNIDDPKKPIFTTTSNAFNWQQGSRLQWLDKKKFIFNDFCEETKKYIARVIDLDKNFEEKVISMPIQSLINSDEYLSINYHRLAALRPDYGYFNIDPATLKLNNLDDDGIWKVSIKENSSKLIYSLHEIINFNKKTENNNLHHKVNHLMLSPDKKNFLIIHRSFDGKKRFGRLLIGNVNGKGLVELPSNKMVSHYTWLNNDEVLGYLSIKDKKDGYFKINIRSNSIDEMQSLNALTLGDGHPICIKENIIVTDSYPDRFGFQSLYIYDSHENSTNKIAYLRHSRQYKLENRCDLHPKPSVNDNYFYFDSVMTNKRRFYRYKIQ